MANASFEARRCGGPADARDAALGPGHEGGGRAARRVSSVQMCAQGRGEAASAAAAAVVCALQCSSPGARPSPLQALLPSASYVGVFLGCGGGSLASGDLLAGKAAQLSLLSAGTPTLAAACMAETRMRLVKDCAR